MRFTEREKRLADSEPRLQQRSVHLSLTLRRITHQDNVEIAFITQLKIKSV